MVFPNVEVNYLAVFVSAIVSMIIGSIWYGPLFGKQWMSLMGFTQKDIEKAKKKGMGKLYFAGFVSALVMAFVLAHFVGVFATTVMEGIQTAFWIWIGFFATVMLGSVLWEGKSVKLYILNVAYYIVNLIIISTILVLWR